MTPTELLAACEVVGIHLEVRGDQLHVEAPAGVVTPELREALVQHKADLLPLLAPVTEFVTLKGGLTVPVPALKLVLDLEARGLRMSVDAGEQFVIEPVAASRTPIRRASIAGGGTWGRSSDTGVQTATFHSDDQSLLAACRRRRAPAARLSSARAGGAVSTSALNYDVPHPVQRPAWPELLERAADIVHSYDTLVTLRQLFYRLVAALLLPNTMNAYKSLSKYTAAARHAGAFPTLMDRGRTIHRYQTFASPMAATRWLKSIYRRDRTAGQTVSLYLGVEKAGIVAQLEEWFGDLGVPVLALGGYSSQTYEADVMADVAAAQRPAVLLYAGDHDPSGEDIDRDFIAKTDCWEAVRRVALTAAQVEQYALPPQPGKERDSRARGFVERYGRLVQVELDALPPDILRALFAEAIAEFWDDDAYQESLRGEAADRRKL